MNRCFHLTHKLPFLFRPHFIYIAYAGRARNLFVLKQFVMVQWCSTTCAFRYSSWWTCNRLCKCCPKRKDVGITIAYSSITKPSGTNYKGTELSKSMCAYHFLDFVQLVTQCVPFPYSIARNGSDKPAKVQTNVFSGGHWHKRLYWYAWDSGKCAIWKHSSKQRNWFNMCIVTATKPKLSKKSKTTQIDINNNNKTSGGAVMVVFHSFQPNSMPFCILISVPHKTIN